MYSGGTMIGHNEPMISNNKPIIGHNEPIIRLRQMVLKKREGETILHIICSNILGCKFPSFDH